MKDQETLEEVVEKIFNIPEEKKGDVYFSRDIAHLRKGFKLGAKWYQEQSDERFKYKEEPKQETENLKNFKKLVSDEISPAMKDFIKEKQETLEEVAERILFENTKNVEIRYRGGRDSVIKSMLDIAQWQQEQDKKMYSEEDMKIAFNANIKAWISFEEFIEQFKKK
jgi:hypothetical protein